MPNIIKQCLIVNLIKQKAMIDTYRTEKADGFLVKLSNILKKNCAKSELFAGDKVIY